MRWAEVANDPVLRDLPYKVELNAYGKIEMSPATTRHARLQAHIAAEFARQLRDGVVLTECPVLTSFGVRVPDVAWASPLFFGKHGETSPLPAAPEICVEIVSPSNSDEEMRQKIAAYLAAGAREVWAVSEDGAIQFFDAQGACAASGFPLRISLPAREPGASGA
jgi:Uma2 family endonuclease